MLLEPPVTPDAPTAHRWAVEELSDPAYHQSENLLVRLLRWLLQQFQGLPALGVSPALAALLVVGGLTVVVLVALWVAGPVRRSRRWRPVESPGRSWSARCRWVAAPRSPCSR